MGHLTGEIEEGILIDDGDRRFISAFSQSLGKIIGPHLHKLLPQIGEPIDPGHE